MSSSRLSSQDFAEFFDMNAFAEHPPVGWEQSGSSASTDLEAHPTSPTFTYDLSIDRNQPPYSPPADDVLTKSACKRLIQSQPPPLVYSQRTLHSAPDTEIQGWVKDYLYKKNSVIHFTPEIETILSNLIGNFYGLATSLADLFVDNAISQALDRNDRVVGPQDFAFVDFDLRAENVNPLSAQIHYKLNNLSKDGFVCSSCGKIPVDIPVFGTASVTNSRKPTKRTSTKSNVAQSVKPNKKQKMSHPEEEPAPTISSASRNKYMDRPAETSNSQAVLASFRRSDMGPTSSSPGVILKTPGLTLRHSTPETDVANPIAGPSSSCSDITNGPRQGPSGFDASKLARRSSSTLMPPPSREHSFSQLPGDFSSSMFTRLGSSS